MVNITIRRPQQINVIVSNNDELHSDGATPHKTYTNDEYSFIQASASNTWTVNHNLHRKPSSVSVLSPGGVEVEASITHINDNQLIVSFSVPYSGSVRIS